MADPYAQMPESDKSTTGSQPARDPAEVEKLAGEVIKNYHQWQQYQRTHEPAWFVTAAMLRGQQHVAYDTGQASLIVPAAPTYAVRLDLNKMLPKHRARMAKFFKNRPKPMVIPASTEYQDLMNARASERVLNYQWQRLRLESAYRDAKQWASVCSKSYWWLSYDPLVRGRVQMEHPETGATSIADAEVGDVAVEVGNAWEVLVKDPNKARVGQQEQIMRVRHLSKSEATRRFPELGNDPDLQPSEGATASSGESTQDAIGLLSAAGSIATIAQAGYKDKVLLLEQFTAPCGQYPRGEVRVVVANKLVRHTKELPFGFWDNPTNPFPCVEFADTGLVGQFWNTTWNEQLVPLQRVLNRCGELIMENAEAVSRPKIVVYRQHNLPDGAWTSSAGEIVTLTWVPGLPPPIILQPQSVAGDLWNMINLVNRQIDEISQIHTASEGGGSGQESGYQTNLLQEATDAVHAPDIRGDELTIEDAAWKIRRIMKRTWDVPRLLAVGGDNSISEMLEFSKDQIDEAAEVRIQIGSMLPDLKAAKAQVVMQQYKEGLLGDPTDPSTRHRALQLLEQYGMGIINEEDRRDEDEASRENKALLGDGFVKPAQFFQRHEVHILKHEAEMKTPQFAMLTPEDKLEFIGHVITHYDFVALPIALGLRAQYGLVEMPLASPPPPPPPGQASAPGAPPPMAEPAPPSAPMMPPASPVLGPMA